MAAIQNELRKKKMGFKFYETIENGESKVYKRGDKELPVWSKQSCYKKIADKMAEDGRAAISELFKKLYNTLYEYQTGTDPMIRDWFDDCCNRMADTWEEYDRAHPAPPSIPVPATTEVEAFGVDDVEDFVV
jgi:hypothetical protein